MLLLLLIVKAEVKCSIAKIKRIDWDILGFC